MTEPEIIVTRDLPGGKWILMINMRGLRAQHITFNKTIKRPVGFKMTCVKTTRHLHTRVSEHLGISPVTGRPSSCPVMSSILSHLNSTGHSASFDDFKILSSCADTGELMIHESLLISKLKPSLNVQGSSIPLNLLYSTISHLFFLFCLYCLVMYRPIPSYPSSI